MSDIAFVNRLGDALDVMAAAPAAGPQSRHRWIPQIGRRHPRLLAFGVVLLLAGCSATAVTLLNEKITSLAARGVTCSNGTPQNYTVQVADVWDGVGSPAAACAQSEHIPAARLVACASPQLGVVVYVRDGRSRECAAAGMTGLPAGYVRAASRIAILIRDLNRLYDSKNCFKPSALVAATQATLADLGFQGWQAQLLRSQYQRWPCGAFPGSGSRSSDAASALTWARQQHTVEVVTGPSLRQTSKIESFDRLNLTARTAARCYSLSGLQSLVQGTARAAFGSKVVVTFAARSTPLGANMMLAERPRYAAGCATLAYAGVSPDGTVRALIWQKESLPLAGSRVALPTSAFKRVLGEP
jgi:hypothetical protein